MKAFELAAAFVFLAAIFVGPAAGAGGEAKALFYEKCEYCHSADAATGINDTSEGWRETVTRMREDNGAPLSAEEAETIIKYLSENYGR